MRMCRSDVSTPREGETLDVVLQGRLKIIQPERGYRFSMDALLLAGLTRIQPQERVLDLGTGCGVIPLLLAVRQPVSHITGIEIQESLAFIARRNILINNLTHLISIVQDDLKQAYKGMTDEQFTLVLSNPPYGQLGGGRLNPTTEKAVARHEVLANLGDVVHTAAQFLPHKGRLALIYPARRLPHLLWQVSQKGFTPKRLTLIHSTLNSAAKLVHLESLKGGGEALLVRKPFVIYRKDGNYTAEMAAICGNAPAVF